VTFLLTVATLRALSCPARKHALPDTYMEGYSRLSPPRRDAVHGRDEARRKSQTLVGGELIAFKGRKPDENVCTRARDGKYVPALRTLSELLDKGVEHSKAKGIDAAALLKERLAPDMFPLALQVQQAPLS
jgi:Domain of unknown function (DUF1993)